MSASIVIDAAATLEEKLESARRQLHIPGLVVGVYHGEATLGEYALGFANLATSEPMSVEHAFRIGSLTKPIVATAALTMVDDDVVDLDRPVAHWFGPGVPEIDGGEVITLAMLLNHRSGLVEYLRVPGVKERYAASPKLRRAPESLLDDVFNLGEPFAFGPGETQGYSNTNYMLAGRVLELVSGRSLGDLLQERVFVPLNVDRTAYLLGSEMPKRAARGYQLGDADGPVWWRPTPQMGTVPHDVTDASPTMWHGAGAVVSTLRDVRTLMQAMADGRLISEALHQRRLDGLKHADQLDSIYSLGLERWRGSVIGHAGQVAGYHVRAGVVADQGGRLIVVLTNLYGSPGSRAPADEVFELVRAHFSSPPPLAVDRDGHPRAQSP